ncbi:Thioredoxin domain-containing protein [Fusarium keratoplasticum]|uniref:Thioredoxin domain-containing protein n=1 Tax=Fusarium keratoplasticum TaxID=1328300 RepID=A0ACC0R624_9HYPO|nr:Thioredoxin domain-containing protein [Fusarium keratoplasticum]KAI8675354.1 Thioredoxin domain-containing protein [Fusarium keratoplasticum]KAI8681799.1 Thioredoxin domain-containing protein [Fusarium keratoplasticum]
MSSQSEQLTAIAQSFKGAPGFEPITAAIEDFVQFFKPQNAIQVGDKFPSFRLSDATGKEVSSDDLLANGPLLITFYRGEWCPYCNIALQHLQRHLDEYKARGVTLVALTPELPDYSLTTAEKNEIKFPVLTDRNNEVAKKLGIVFDQVSAKDLFKQVGVDLTKRNGLDNFEVPIPATLLVDGSGVVRNVFIDPDYRNRMEPKVALEWIDALKN